MSVLSQEEIDLIKKNPDLAAVAKKLEEGSWIPKSRFDEVNTKQKELADQLEKIGAERIAAEKKAMEEQGKFKELAEQRAKDLAEKEAKLKDESAVAEQYRTMLKTKREDVKKALGEKWLPIYDQASLDELQKLEKMFTTINSDNPDGHPPGSRVDKVGLDKIDSKDFNRMIDDVKAGKKIQLKKE
jgi:vacuolar-type H+-ATPase subunit I/STV1